VNNLVSKVPEMVEISGKKEPGLKYLPEEKMILEGL
jgi:hypothetical protein